MSDNEIEDIQFIPGSRAGKRGVYEPHGLQKCKHLICTPMQAISIVASVLVVILLVSLIAALARPPAQCSSSHTSSPVVSLATTTPDPLDDTALWPHLRLPRDISPLVYDIFMHPNLTDFTFKGTVMITVEVAKATNMVVFHSKNLTLSPVVVYDESNKQLQVETQGQHLGHEIIYVVTKEQLAVGRKYQLVIDFSSVLSTNLAGFYRSSYTNKDGQQRWLATTQFEATDARAAFPCFDEPQMKAQFRLAIVRSKDYITLFNTEQVKQEPFDEDPALVVDHYNISVKMSTYLVAFIVCDFDRKTAKTSDGKNVNVYAPPDYIEEATLASQTAPAILEFYEQFYKVPYPLEKSDHVAIPDFSAGAMENWGLITYRMRSLLVNDTTAPPMDRQWVVMVIAHELAHQWFGNIVTMEWWNDLWLNEGFASYVEYKGAHHVQPDWNMLDQFLIATVWTAMRYDGLKSSHPISSNVTNPSDIEELFDAISYDKGASIIRMLDSFLGEENFKEGLHRYLTKYKYSNARTRDLWATLSETAEEGIDVVKVMNSWTQQMGYPVVSVQQNGNQVSMTQERFLFNKRSLVEENFESPYGYKWYIPLSYTTDLSGNDKSELEWMEPITDKKTITLPGGRAPRWIKFNANHTGVYRVHYSPDMYRELVNQLMDDHTVFTAADRASLIGDVFALARSGHVEISQALDLSRYLDKETEYVPLETAMQCFRYIARLMADKSSYSALEAYILSRLKPLMTQDLWQEVSGQLNKYRQEMVLSNAIYLQDNETIHTALNVFHAWMNGEDVKPSLKSLVYMTGAKHGGRREWDHLFSRYKSASQLEMKQFLMSLAATTDAVRLQRLLDMSLDPEQVRTQDTASLIGAIAANPAGQVLAWSFVKRNWDIIFDRYSGMAFQLKHFIEIARHLSSTYDYNEVKAFFEEHLPGQNQRSVSQTLENIEMNIDWLDRNKSKLDKWVKDYLAQQPAGA